MKSFTEPMEPEKFYHLYNRGINGCNLFLEDTHYRKFLEKYTTHTSGVLTTFGYCLLKNHFHLLVRTKSETEIRMSNPHLASKSIEQIISNQLGHLFNGYAQYFNTATQRTGKLFELPFRRKTVTSDAYFSQLLYYIHTNPQKHGLVSNFKDYKYSSFWSFVSKAPTKLAREEVLKWFGNENVYMEFHQENVDISGIKDLMIELD
jgi:putative transposase